MIDRMIRRWSAVCVPLLTVVISISGCGNDSAKGGSKGTLSAAEAKKVLRKLPYRYAFIEVKLPHGASAAIAGRVYGRHQTQLTFGASFGDHPKPVSVPNTQVGDIAGTPYFTYTSNLQEPSKTGGWKRGKQLRTPAQWNEAINMVVRMEQAFCLAVTGEGCGI